MICGDFNARSSLWDQHGTNQQGCALEAALSDVLFTPVTTASPTHPVHDRVTQTVQSIWHWCPQSLHHGRVQKLASHGSDHLPVVFSLQTPGVGPRRKLQYPSQYGKSEMDVMSKLRARKPATQQIHDRKPPSKHPGGTRNPRQPGLQS